MQTINFLSQGLDYKDFEIQDFLYTAPNLPCDIALASNIRTSQKFLIKIVSITDSSHEASVLTEIELLKKLNLHPFKPKSLPQYFGYAKEEENNKKIVYNIVYEQMEINLKKRIKARMAKHEIFPFDCIQKCFNSLVNTLAFLQNLDICPLRLDCDSLFLNSNEKNFKLIDFTTSQNLIPEILAHSCRNTLYLAPELLQALESKSSEQGNKIQPYKSLVFSIGIIILELLTFQLPKNEKSQESEILRLIEEANTRYLNLKNSPEFDGFMVILQEIMSMNPNERPDCLGLFWRNSELRSSLNKNHLMHHIFIEDSDCSELQIFNELKTKGKNFHLQDAKNPSDELIGIGQKVLQKEFIDTIGLQVHLSDVKPLRGINIKTIKGDLPKDFKFWDDVVLEKENWDLENYPIKTVIFQANAHEKLIDDEYKKYYYNVFMKNAIKSNEVCEEGAVKILHQHDWNFMEGVNDDQLEPIFEKLKENFIKGNFKLEKLCLLFQRFLLILYFFLSEILLIY